MFFLINFVRDILFGRYGIEGWIISAYLRCCPHSSNHKQCQGHHHCILCLEKVKRNHPNPWADYPTGHKADISQQQQWMWEVTGLWKEVHKSFMAQVGTPSTKGWRVHMCLYSVAFHHRQKREFWTNFGKRNYYKYHLQFCKVLPSMRGDWGCRQISNIIFLV